ncbi:putative disease resistance protein RGA1 [Quercus robur]|uniref:putative disease resistance protein RGA1 n=1 Tax=Quercus robur TaxID=38942 RepID=UPI002161F4D1|nr:putative disease resistance protein RGA1 [Quercus robur]
MLVIGDCENFTTSPEWLPCLKSLQQLGIDNCCKLLSLPEGMQGLTALRQLNITLCPDLIRNCKEDRSKIAHVPEVCLGGDRLENQIKIRYSYDSHKKFWKYCWREEELRQQEEEKRRRIQETIRVALSVQRKALGFIEQE